MAVQLLLTNWAAVYFSGRRMTALPVSASVVQLRDRCNCSLTGNDLLQGTEGDHERDVRLAIAGHVRAAVRKGGGVDGDFQGATGVASTHVSNEDVVVHGRFFFGFSFFKIFKQICSTYSLHSNSVYRNYPYASLISIEIFSCQESTK